MSIRCQESGKRGAHKEFMKQNLKRDNSNKDKNDVNYIHNTNIDKR